MRKLLIILIFNCLIIFGGQAQVNINSSANLFRSQGDSVIYVDTTGLCRLNLSLSDGGLAPQPGVTNIQIFRSTKDAPEIADGDGWTYAHHMDLAIWKGKLYAAWNTTLKDEDRPPSKIVYSTSPDGITWTKPIDLFPRESAWACRFYFFRASNDRMLTFCVAKNKDGEINEAKKSILQVREINANHELGPVYVLVNPTDWTAPSFETSTDVGFVTACREALSNNMLLEQQDYGVFLGDRRMIWHDKTPPYKGSYKFGKAFDFFHRADGKIVGLTKMGFATTSDDGGKSWSEPVLPSTLTAGAAKVWGQKATDNQFVLAYNPDPKKGKRFPLVLVNGTDGSHFKEMRVIHGEYSPLRYPGLYKDIGYQYVRGVAEWSTDNSLKEKSSLWLIYSVNKEDVWVSRIQIPVRAELPDYPNDSFDNLNPGKYLEGWNVYAPKWCPVNVVQENGPWKNQCLALADSDPVEHAQAMRLFPSTQAIETKFRVRPEQTGAYFETELVDSDGSPMFQVRLEKGNQIIYSGGGKEVLLGNYLSGKWLDIIIKADLSSGQCSTTINGKSSESFSINTSKSKLFQRLIFRTGKRFDLNANFKLEKGSDKPAKKGARFLVDEVTVGQLKR